MKKELDYELVYFEKGQEKTKKIKIFFASQKVQRDYGSWLSGAAQIMKLNEERTELIEDFGSLMVNKELSFADKREKMKALKALITLKNKEIIDLSGEDQLRSRFEITKRLLNDNGVIDEDLLDYSFWDEKVEPHVSNEFLQLSIYKDHDLKKKL